MGTVESGTEKIQGQRRESPRAYRIGMSRRSVVAVELWRRTPDVRATWEEAFGGIVIHSFVLYFGSMPSAHNTYRHHARRAPRHFCVRM
jgi:hypothetical protein